MFLLVVINFCFLLLFFDMCASSTIVPKALLLKNFTLKDARMDCILSMLFSCSCSNSPDVTCLKYLWSKSVTSTIAMLSQMFMFGVTAAVSHLTSTQTLENTLVTNLSNPFGLLIFGYISSFCNIKYTIPIPICNQTALSFSTFAASCLCQ